MSENFINVTIAQVYRANCMYTMATYVLTIYFRHAYTLKNCFITTDRSVGVMLFLSDKATDDQFTIYDIAKRKLSSPK